MARLAEVIGAGVHDGVALFPDSFDDADTAQAVGHLLRQSAVAPERVCEGEGRELVR